MKRIIGKTDIADFPELNLFDISVKIDSGAYTSSIHCRDAMVDKNGILRFKLYDPTHNMLNNREISVKDFSQKNVKSSNSAIENRYIITSKIVLFGESFEVELSLTNRGDMRYPVLLGRKLLSNNFLIDAKLKEVSYAEKLKTAKNRVKNKL